MVVRAGFAGCAAARLLITAPGIVRRLVAGDPGPFAAERPA